MGFIIILIFIPIFLLLIISNQYILAGLTALVILILLAYRFYHMRRLSKSEPLEDYEEEILRRTEGRSVDDIGADVLREVLNDLEKFKDIPEMDTETIRYLQLFYFQKLQQSQPLKTASSEQQQTKEQQQNMNSFYTQLNKNKNIFSRFELPLSISLLFFGFFIYYVTARLDLSLIVWTVGLLPFLFNRQILNINLVKYFILTLLWLITLLAVVFMLKSTFDAAGLSRIYFALDFSILALITTLLIRGEAPVILKVNATFNLAIALLSIFILIFEEFLPFGIPITAACGIIFTLLLIELIRHYPHFLGIELNGHFEFALSIYILILPLLSIINVIFWQDYNIISIIMTVFVVLFTTIFAIYQLRNQRLFLRG